MKKFVDLGKFVWKERHPMIYREPLPIPSDMNANCDVLLRCNVV